MGEKAKNIPLQQQIEKAQNLYGRARVNQALAKALKNLAKEFSQNKEDLTSQEAADFLGVSRPHLVQLLDNGIIPHYKVGSHRRVKTNDVLSYKTRREQRANSLKKMVDLGGYED